MSPREPYTRDPSAYGERFGLNYPTSGPETIVAAVDIGDFGIDRSPEKPSQWTVVVSVDEWPDMLDADKQIAGPPIFVRIRAGQSNVVAPEQTLYLPAGGLAIQTVGEILRAEVIVFPDAGVTQNARLSGTIQIRSGQPQEFITNATIVVGATSAETIPIPPFATLWKSLVTSTVSIVYGFNPRNGGKTLDIAANNSGAVRSGWLPIPSAATSVTVTNSGGTVNTSVLAFKGYI